MSIEDITHHLVFQVFFSGSEPILLSLEELTAVCDYGRKTALFSCCSITPWRRTAAIMPIIPKREHITIEFQLARHTEESPSERWYWSSTCTHGPFGVFRRCVWQRVKFDYQLQPARTTLGFTYTPGSSTRNGQRKL
jgi:hypothetical protein